MQNIHSQKFLRKRKFMMVLPLLTLPFVTLAFWAMGGGTSENNPAVSQPGLNMQLPDANLADESKEDKLSFYNKAKEDSLKLRQEMQNDPYYRNSLDGMKISENISVAPLRSSNGHLLNPTPHTTGTVTDPNEAKIYEKLNALNKVIQQPYDNLGNKRGDLAVNQQENSNRYSSADIDRLESMMKVMNDKGTNDPEMEQLGSMLDKILDIQHPERVKNSMKDESPENKTQVQGEKEIDATYFGSQTTGKNKIKRIRGNSFYGEDNQQQASDLESNTVPAVIPETQTVTSGSIIKLRLLTDIRVNRLVIPKGSFLFGRSSLEKERLLVNISAIRYDNNLVPVSLSVYDMDGVAGIHVPGSISRDVAKQAADQSLQSIEVMSSLDPSLKAQAMSAGVQAAKGLLSKKVKLVKLTLKAGYRVLLVDEKQQDH